MNTISAIFLSAILCAAVLNVPAAGGAPKKPETASKRLRPEEATLIAGSPVALDALATLDWIQGSAPDQWEPGKGYVFECWATWCGPCIAAIPHLNELHAKYSEKGLVLSGINVWEDDKEKVAKFVKRKGPDMSYNVGFTGKGGAFETEWLNPAGVSGIPHAFVVKDGILILKTHPKALTDAAIEGLLEGGAAQKKIVERITAEDAIKLKTSNVLRRYNQPAVQGDAKAIGQAIAELEKIDAESRFLPMMRFHLLTVRKDWTELEAAIGNLPEGIRHAALLKTSRAFANSEDEIPASLTRTLAVALKPTVKSFGTPFDIQMASALLWEAGENKSALELADLAVAKATARPNAGVPIAAFEAYAQAMRKGTPLSKKEFNAQVKAKRKTH